MGCAPAGAPGQDLTSFSKVGERSDPKVIAHRSAATRGEMLVNPDSYARFRHKADINHKVRARAPALDGHRRLLASHHCRCH